MQRPNTSKTISNKTQMAMLETENQVLKEKVHKLGAIVSSYNKGTLQKPIQNNEYKDKLIESLKKRLVESEVHLQKASQGEPDEIKDNSDLIKQIRDKDLHLQALQARFDTIEGTFKEKEHIFERTKAMLEESFSELQTKKAEVINLKTQLSSAVYAADQSKDILKDYMQLKSQKEELEKRLFEISQTSFLNKPSANESLNRLKSAEIELTQCRLKMEALKDDVLRKEIEKGKIEDKVKALDKDRLQAKEELIRYKAKYENDGVPLMDIPRMLKENDSSNFREVMEKLKVTGLPKWAEIDFLEKRNTLDASNPNELINEIDRLKLEKAQLASELEKAQMQLKMKDEEDYEKEKLYDDKIKELQGRLHAESEKYKNYVMSISKSPNVRDKGADIYENESDFTDIKAESVIDKDQNKIDFLVTRAEFNESNLRSLNILKENQIPLTYAIIDFYNHPSLKSDMFDGYSPEYLLQVQYKIVVNEELLEHLNTGCVHIDIFMLDAANTNTKIAQTDVSMKALLNSGSSYCKPIEYNAILQSTQKSNISVGKLQVKYRMRHPLISKIENVMKTPSLKSSIQIGLEIKVIGCENLSSINKSADKLCPYVGYRLFNHKGFNYTNGGIGPNPQFNETSNFIEPLSNEFLEYMAKEEMEFIVLDNVSPLEEANIESQSLARVTESEKIGNALLKLSEIKNAGRYALSLPIRLDGNDCGTLKIEVGIDRDI